MLEGVLATSHAVDDVVRARYLKDTLMRDITTSVSYSAEGVRTSHCVTMKSRRVWLREDRDEQERAGKK